MSSFVGSKKLSFRRRLQSTPAASMPIISNAKTSSGSLSVLPATCIPSWPRGTRPTAAVALGSSWQSTYAILHRNHGRRTGSSVMALQDDWGGMTFVAHATLEGKALQNSRFCILTWLSLPIRCCNYVLPYHPTQPPDRPCLSLLRPCSIQRLLPLFWPQSHKISPRFSRTPPSQHLPLWKLRFTSQILRRSPLYQRWRRLRPHPLRSPQPQLPYWNSLLEAIIGEMGSLEKTWARGSKKAEVMCADGVWSAEQYNWSTPLTLFHSRIKRVL